MHMLARQGHRLNQPGIHEKSGNHPNYDCESLQLKERKRLEHARQHAEGVDGAQRQPESLHIRLGK